MMKRLRPLRPVLAVAALAWLVSACSFNPVGGNGTELTGVQVGGRSIPADGVYVVQRGDTIYGIAREYNLSVRSLIDANRLVPPYQLTVGQVLRLSTSNEYVVRPGDSLLRIARKTGVSYSTLLRMNAISNPNHIRIGQRLQLPVAGAETAAAAPVAQNQIAPVAQNEAAPAAAGEEPAPAAAESAPPPARSDGYRPLGEREAAAAPPPPPPPPPAAAEPAAAPAPAAAEPAPAAAAAEAAAVPSAPPPPPESGQGFLWPVKGRVIDPFGAAGKGVHNDGINIAVSKDTPVRAAQDGVVVYAGNELRGFGNLLLIKHANGWTTAYAHNDRLMVRRGETVRRGQEVALSGDSGGVTEPQLHFEIRHGTRAVNPETLLKE
ncbi:murein hydrolase activator NlpD precursor [mine drainage metagenome]|uniref:Murein hydrolase activator NlpD n=1 Tax=mine drainage metagenome TaxID=410659 RepID=A0A1J5RKB3_9ZZZZ